MKVLFIGGTGIISSACAELAVKNNIHLIFLNRGHTDRRVPEGVRVIHADIRNEDETAAVLKNETFDAVVNWIAFSPDHIESDLRLFRDRVGQYIFISSASAYQTPPEKLPVTESTPLDNPFWLYSRNKIACEKLLMRAWQKDKFPATIVRPSHTYDERTLPFTAGYTVVDRMRRGKPVVVHGDGTSLWVLTHHRDFAKGFIGLLGNASAIGDAFHITSDELLNWNRIYLTVAEAAGVSGPKLLHAPSGWLAKLDKEWGDNLLGDKSQSMIFDNSKIKQAVPGFRASIPFSQGAKEVMKWYDADPARRKINPDFDKLFDRVVEALEPVQPPFINPND